MNRRSLLTMIPAATAALALPAHASALPPSATTKAGFAICIQCWSFNRFSLWDAIPMAASAGATAIEIFPGQKLGGPHGDSTLSIDMTDEQIRSIREHLDKHHLTAANFGVTPIAKDPAKARQLFEFAKKFGLYGITTESIDAIDTIEPLAKEFDLKICFHNHPKPTALWNPETIWTVIKDRHANIGFCADVGHWASSGLNPVEVVKKYAGRIHSFHMKDRASITEWTHDRPFGTGIIDLQLILSTVTAQGFAGNISIEYEYNWEKSLPEIAQCCGYLRAFRK